MSSTAQRRLGRKSACLILSLVATGARAETPPETAPKPTTTTAAPEPAPEKEATPPAASAPAQDELDLIEDDADASADGQGEDKARPAGPVSPDVKAVREPDTLAGRFEQPVGFYGGVGARYFNLEDRRISLLNVRGGMVFDKRLGFGFVVDQMITRRDAPIPYSDREMDLAITGFFLEYIFSADSLVHMTTGITVGNGSIVYVDNEHDRQRIDQKDFFFVVEPEINVEVNVTEFFRLNLGLTHRTARGVGLAGFRDKSFSGPSAQIGLRLGRY